MAPEAPAGAPLDRGVVVSEELEIVTRSPAETEAVGAALARFAFPGAVLLLEGALGAGKTALARGVARGLQVAEAITSPSFTILAAYEGRYPLFHLDLFRLERPDDLRALDLAEIFESGGVAVVEWPRWLIERPPAGALAVELRIEGPEERRLIFQPRDARWGGLRDAGALRDAGWPAPVASGKPVAATRGPVSSPLPAASSGPSPAAAGFRRPPWILAFYTASDPGSVALRTEGGESEQSLERTRQFELLVPAAQELLRAAGLEASGLDGVAVARGPGSFTGLRIGAAAALGLVRGAGIALFTAGTLEVWASLALVAKDAGTLCRVALDARRGELYVADFQAPASEVRGGAPELLAAPRVLPVGEALAGLHEDASVVGDGRELMVAAGLEPDRPGFSRPPEALALALARLVALNPAKHVCPLESFRLDYVREPQAAVARGATMADAPTGAHGAA